MLKRVHNLVKKGQGLFINQSAITNINEPLLTLTVALLFVLLGTSGTPIPNAVSLLQLLTVYSAFNGGIRSGLISALITFFYAALMYFHGDVSALFQFQQILRIEELLVVFLTTFAMALLSGILKHRSERLLSEEIERAKVEEISQILAKSEKQYRELFEKNPLPMWIVDKKNMQFVTVNKAARNLYGYTKKEFSQMSLTDIRPAEDVPKFLEFFKAPRSLQTVRPAGHWRHVTKQGQILQVESFWTQIQFENKVCLLLMLSDITERVELEKRKDEFVSMASHEFKTPITTIKGYTQMLQKQLIENGRAKIHLTRMDEQLTRLTALVNDMLDVSRIQTGRLILRKEVFDVVELAAQVVDDSQRLTENHTITCTGVRKCLVEADRYRMHQVLSNLLSNAIKYSPSGGKIIIRISQSKDHLTISVQDTGIGISQELLTKVFDRFYRVDPQSRHNSDGLGLGLYICSQIIQLHEGKIWAESTVNKGSTFNFELPKIVH